MNELEIPPPPPSDPPTNVHVPWSPPRKNSHRERIDTIEVTRPVPVHDGFVFHPALHRGDALAAPDDLPPEPTVTAVLDEVKYPHKTTIHRTNRTRHADDVSSSPTMSPSSSSDRSEVSRLKEELATLTRERERERADLLERLKREREELRRVRSEIGCRPISQVEENRSYDETCRIAEDESPSNATRPHRNVTKDIHEAFVGLIREMTPTIRDRRTDRTHGTVRADDVSSLEVVRFRRDENPVAKSATREGRKILMAMSRDVRYADVVRYGLRFVSILESAHEKSHDLRRVYDAARRLSIAALRRENLLASALSQRWRRWLRSLY